jgi:hypothetical protein
MVDVLDTQLGASPADMPQPSQAPNMRPVAAPEVSSQTPAPALMPEQGIAQPQQPQQPQGVGSPDDPYSKKMYNYLKGSPKTREMPDYDTFMAKYSKDDAATRDLYSKSFKAGYMPNDPYFKDFTIPDYNEWKNQMFPPVKPAEKLTNTAETANTVLETQKTQANAQASGNSANAAFKSVGEGLKKWGMGTTQKNTPPTILEEKAKSTTPNTYQISREGKTADEFASAAQTAEQRAFALGYDKKQESYAKFDEQVAKEQQRNIQGASSTTTPQVGKVADVKKEEGRIASDKETARIIKEQSEADDRGFTATALMSNRLGDTNVIHDPIDRIVKDLEGGVSDDIFDFYHSEGGYIKYDQSEERIDEQTGQRIPGIMSNNTGTFIDPYGKPHRFESNDELLQLQNKWLSLSEEKINPITGKSEGRVYKPSQSGMAFRPVNEKTRRYLDDVYADFVLNNPEEAKKLGIPDNVKQAIYNRGTFTMDTKWDVVKELTFIEKAFEYQVKKLNDQAYEKSQAMKRYIESRPEAERDALMKQYEIDRAELYERASVAESYMGEILSGMYKAAAKNPMLSKSLSAYTEAEQDQKMLEYNREQRKKQYESLNTAGKAFFDIVDGINSARQNLWYGLENFGNMITGTEKSQETLRFERLKQEEMSATQGNPLRELTEMVVQTSAIMAPVGNLGAGFTALGMGAKAAQTAGIVTSSYLQTVGSMYTDAIQMGMGVDEALIYANSTAVALGFVEALFPSDFIFAGKRDLTRDIFNIIKKTDVNTLKKMSYSDLVNNVTREYFKEIGKESLIEEQASLIAEKLSGALANLALGKDYFDNEITGKEILETAGWTSMVTGIIGAPRVYRGLKNRNMLPMQMSLEYQAAEYKDGIEKRIDASLKSGELSKEQATVMRARLGELVKAKDKVDQLMPKGEEFPKSMLVSIQADRAQYKEMNNQLDPESPIDKALIDKNAEAIEAMRDAEERLIKGDNAAEVYNDYAAKMHKLYDGVEVAPKSKAPATEVKPEVTTKEQVPPATEEVAADIGGEKASDVSIPEAPKSEPAQSEVEATAKALEGVFNPEFKNTIIDKLSKFDKQIKDKKFPSALEVAEHVLPRSVFNKYKKLYELAARNNITVSNERLPYSMTAAWAYGNIQLNKDVAKYYMQNFDEFAETLNHEIIHGLLSRGIRNNYALFTDLQDVMDQIVSKFDSASDEVKEIISYIQDTRNEFIEQDILGASEQELDSDKYREVGSLEELITYAFTNKEFANFLDSIPASKDIKIKGDSIFQQLKSIIRDFIGKTTKSATALDEINSVLDKYFDTTWNESQIAERNKTHEWNLRFSANENIFDKYNNDSNKISEAYHKAKADGSNPELVKAVEELLGKKGTSPEISTPVQEISAPPVTESAPELADVEATAKALEEKQAKEEAPATKEEKPKKPFQVKLAGEVTSVEEATPATEEATTKEGTPTVDDVKAKRKAVLSEMLTENGITPTDAALDNAVENVFTAVNENPSINKIKTLFKVGHGKAIEIRKAIMERLSDSETKAEPVKEEAKEKVEKTAKEEKPKPATKTKLTTPEKNEAKKMGIDTDNAVSTVETLGTPIRQKGIEVEAAKKMETSEVQMVAIDELIPTQRVVDSSKLAEASESEEPILVRRARDGKLLIMDGHHRTVAAKVNGNTEVPVVVIEDGKKAPKKEAPKSEPTPQPSVEATKVEKADAIEKKTESAPVQESADSTDKLRKAKETQVKIDEIVKTAEKERSVDNYKKAQQELQVLKEENPEMKKEINEAMNEESFSQTKFTAEDGAALKGAKVGENNRYIGMPEKGVWKEYERNEDGTFSPIEGVEYKNQKEIIEAVKGKAKPRTKAEKLSEEERAIRAARKAQEDKKKAQEKKKTTSSVDFSTMDAKQTSEKLESYQKAVDVRTSETIAKTNPQSDNVIALEKAINETSNEQKKQPLQKRLDAVNETIDKYNAIIEAGRKRLEELNGKIDPDSDGGKSNNTTKSQKTKRNTRLVTMAVEAVAKKLQRAFPNVEVVTQQNEFDAAAAKFGIDPNTLGFTRGGRVYINPSVANANTVAEEFSHLWLEVAKVNNPAIYKKLLELAAKSEYMTQVENDPAYSDAAIAKDNGWDVSTDSAKIAEAKKNEAAAKAIADQIEKVMDKNLFGQMRSAIDAFWRSIGRKLGIPTTVNMSTLNLHELTKAVAKEIANKTPITSLTSDQIQDRIDKFLQDGDTSGIEVDRGMLWEGSRVGRAVNRFNSWARYYFTTGRGVDKTTRNAIEKVAGIVNAESKRAIMNNRAFLNNVKNFVKANAKTKAEKTILTKEILDAADDYLKAPNPGQDAGGGKTKVELYQEMKNKYGEDIAKSVAKMANHIQDLQRKIYQVYKDFGIATEDFEASLNIDENGNIGAWIHRSYAMYDVKNFDKTVEDIKKRLGDSQFNELVDYLRDTLSTDAVSSVEIKKEGNKYRASVTTTTGIVVELGTFSQSDIAGGILDALDIDPDTDIGKNLIEKLEGIESTGMIPNQSISAAGAKLLAGKAIANDVMIKNTMLDIIKANEADKSAMKEAFGTSPLASKKDLELFKKRGDIDPIIRLLMGEYTDPGINYIKSVAAAANHAEKMKLERQLLQDGDGTMFLTEQQLKSQKGAAAVYTKQIPMEKSKTLGGMYTTPEIYKYMFEKDRSVWLNKVIEMRALTWLNHAMKSNVTIFSQASQSRNYTSAALMLAATGHFEYFIPFLPIVYKKTAAAAQAATATWGSAENRASFLAMPTMLTKQAAKVWLPNTTENKEKFIEMYELLSKYGLTNQSAEGGIIKDLATKMYEAYNGSGVFDKAARGYAKASDAVGEVYQATDAIFKAIHFFSMAKKFEKAFESKRSSMSPEAYMNMVYTAAADLAINELPSYDRAPQWVKILSKNPLMGTFIMFDAEVWRTRYNTLVNGFGFLKKAATETDPSARAVYAELGARRVAGTLVGVSISNVFRGVVMAAIGVVFSDDEKEALDVIIGGYDEYSTKIFYGDDVNGKLQYQNLTYIDPLSNIIEAVRAGRRDGLDAFFNEISKPYLSPEIGVGLLTAVVSGEDNMGRPIRTEGDTYSKKLYDTFSFIADNTIPYWSTTGKDVYKSAIGYETTRGSKYDMKTTMLNSMLGLRARSVYMDSREQSHAYDFSKKISKYNEHYQVKKRSNETEAGVERVNEAVKDDYIQMLKVMNAMATLGKSADEIESILSKSIIKTDSKGRPSKVLDKGLVKSLMDDFGKDPKKDELNYPEMDMDGKWNYRTGSRGKKSSLGGELKATKFKTGL